MRRFTIASVMLAVTGVATQRGVDELLFQAIFIQGAHPAHPF
jgi:hypothetical protein